MTWDMYLLWLACGVVIARVLGEMNPEDDESSE